MAYEDLQLNDDPDLLARQMLARQAALQPGWFPHDGSPVTALITTLAERTADTRSLVPPALAEAFRAFGRSVHGLQQIDAVPASTTTAWTLRDNTGHVIPAGTLVAYRPAGVEPVALRTAQDVTVAAGQSFVPDVVVVADEPGAAGNGVPPGPLELLDALSYVLTVVAQSPTTGGVDAETAEQYVGRLADLLTVPTRTPVRPEHFALLARDVPGVTRARGIANYDVDTGTDNVPACVTIYPLDPSGQPSPPAVRAALLSYLSDLRELGFLIRIGLASYTPVTLAYSAVPEVGAAAAVVKAALDQRAAQLLDPARFAGGDERPPTWRPQNALPIGWVQQQLGSVSGVAYLSGLTLNGAATDLLLPGRAPLPAPPGPGGSSVSGAVTAP